MTLIQVAFILSVLVTLGGAVMVVATRRMLHAALWLVLSLFGVAMLFVTLQAGFFAVIQVLVYIGAIAILFIFAVMLTRRIMADTGPQVNRSWVLAAIVSLVVFVGLVVLLNSWQGFSGVQPAFVAEDAMIATMGAQLVSPDFYVIPFEVASILLLAALVGSIYIAGQRK